MLKILSGTLFSGLAALANAGDLPPLDANISYDSKTVTHAGVTESRQFHNRLIRRPGHIWMERVVPSRVDSSHLHGIHPAMPDHKHVDFDTASQHLTRSADGEIRAEYVDHEQRQVIFVPPTEYSVSGFDGSWDNAAELVAKKTVMSMPASARKSAVPDAHWHEQVRNGWYNRVLWSDRYEVALTIESGKTDGTVVRKTIVEPTTATPEDRLPWKKLAGFKQKEYDDFMD